MKTAKLILLAAFAAASVAANATPSNTDEARAEAGQRIAAVEHAAALQSFEAMNSEVVVVTDTDSARRAAGQANARRLHEAHLAEVLRAGLGVKPAPIKVTDSDSARAAGGQMVHQRALLADYAEYVKTQAHASNQ
jgi:methyl coenzyme M reductase alpha subunit